MCDIRNRASAPARTRRPYIRLPVKVNAMPPYDNTVEHGAAFGRWMWDAGAGVLLTHLESGSPYDFDPFLETPDAWWAHLRQKYWVSSQDLDDLERAFVALGVRDA